MSLSILVQIDDAGHAGVTAARLDYNASLPQTVEGPPDADGNATQIPNPALIATDTDYYLARSGGMVASWAAQHAPVIPPPPPPPVVIDGVPQAVDMVKACVYFVSIGVMDAITAAVNAAGPTAQVIWQRSKTVQRQNPLLLQIAYNVLHWTDAEIDNHFVQADKVVV